ncbi:hypothetical protein FPSE5266_02399 [Fusarium pseudograminearum]|nr:hypothetical protein FPSE5266_02399 [Fusarium pseudograminearum]
MAPLLLRLPGELHNTIRALLSAVDIKNLRATCSTLAKTFPLRFDRVFISANSLNIEVFLAVANNEIFRHQVTEIIWDDAPFRTGPNVEEEERQGREPEDFTEYECPRWFQKGCCDYVYRVPGRRVCLKESWAHYQALVNDQIQVVSSNADIEAFNYGLRRFTSLKRVTITPSAHGKPRSPLYRTPMIRAFPAEFDYPLS